MYVILSSWRDEGGALVEMVTGPFTSKDDAEEWNEDRCDASEGILSVVMYLHSPSEF